MRKLFANVPVFDTGGRAATTTFVERGIGDVLVTFEAEVQGIGKQYGKDKVDLVIPPVSSRADFPDLRGRQGGRRARQPEDRRGLSAISLHARGAGDHCHAFQPADDKDVAAKHAKDFTPVRLLTVEDVFGGWKKVNEEHLANGAILDQLYVNK